MVDQVMVAAELVMAPADQVDQVDQVDFVAEK